MLQVIPWMRCPGNGHCEAGAAVQGKLPSATDVVHSMTGVAADMNIKGGRGMQVAVVLQACTGLEPYSHIRRPAFSHGVFDGGGVAGQLHLLGCSTHLPASWGVDASVNEAHTCGCAPRTRQAP